MFLTIRLEVNKGCPQYSFIYTKSITNRICIGCNQFKHDKCVLDSFINDIKIWEVVDYHKMKDFKIEAMIVQGDHYVVCDTNSCVPEVIDHYAVFCDDGQCIATGSAPQCLEYLGLLKYFKESGYNKWKPVYARVNRHECVPITINKIDYWHCMPVSGIVELERRL